MVEENHRYLRYLSRIEGSPWTPCMMAVLHCPAISKADKWLFVCLALADFDGRRSKDIPISCRCFLQPVLPCHFSSTSNPNRLTSVKDIAGAACRMSTSTGLLLNAWRWGIADATGVLDPIQHDFSCTVCYWGLLCAHQSNQEESWKTAKPFNTWFLKLNIYCCPQTVPGHGEPLYCLFTRDIKESYICII